MTDSYVILAVSEGLAENAAVSGPFDSLEDANDRVKTMVYFARFFKLEPYSFYVLPLHPDPDE